MRYGASLLAALALSASAAVAQEMPTINLSTNNCIVGFGVPATWGAIKGRFLELDGWARFGRPGDLNSLHGFVEVDVKAVTTGSEDRDRKWQDYCLERGRFAKITFMLERVKVTENQSFLLSGLLTIRDVTRPLVISGKFTGEAGQYHLIGNGEFKWTNYGVRDSSTFFTKVQPETKVALELWLPVK
jgi:polyisoprenoid-binding protein YceI